MIQHFTHTVYENYSYKTNFLIRDTLDIFNLSSDSKLLSSNRVRYSFFRYFIFENTDSNTLVLPKRASVSLANSRSIGYLIVFFQVSSKFSSFPNFCTSCSSFFISTSSIWRSIGALSVSTRCGKATSLKVFEIFSRS